MSVEDYKHITDHANAQNLGEMLRYLGSDILPGYLRGENTFLDKCEIVSAWVDYFGAVLESDRIDDFALIAGYNISQIYLFRATLEKLRTLLIKNLVEDDIEGNGFVKKPFKRTTTNQNWQKWLIDRGNQLKGSS